ncbi:MAG: hypothetical protein ACK40S_12940 [Burkholderiaceae bacterium]
MPAAILGPIAGSVVGGIMSKGGSGGQQTQSKEPWAPAVKPLTNTLETGQRLENYHQQNPFNPLQQTGYQNLYGDLDAFRNQIAPGMMGFANRLMGTNYQRSIGPTGDMGQMRPMQQAMPDQYQTKPMLMDMGGAMGQGAAQMGPSGGLLGQGGPFMVPQGQSYGLLDFTALNPFTSGAMDKPKQPDETDEERRRREREEEAARRYREDELRGAGA